MATNPTTPNPPVTAAQISDIIQEVGGLAADVLTALAGADPALELPAEVVALIAQLASKALNAWSTASGETITVASVQGLLPNPTPLTPPTS